MTYSSTVTTLACGCEWPGVWDRDWPGDTVNCSTRGHGITTIERITRSRDVAGSRDFKLGVAGDADQPGS